MNSKQCRKCGEVKPLVDFYNQRDGKFGVSGQCRSCINATRRKRRAEDPERFRGYQRKSRAKNLEKTLDRNARYRDNNREKIRENQRMYYAENAGRRERSRAGGRRGIENCADWYVKEGLKRQGFENPSDELIELRRQQIIAKRLIRQAKRRLGNESDSANV